jgi:predicted permease
MLRRAPSVTVPAVAVLALGIAMAATLYAVVYQSWLRPLPYPDPGRLVSVLVHFPSYGLDALESPDYGEWQGTRSLGPLAAYSSDAAALIGPEETVEIRRASVSGNLLGVLGVSAAAGRGILPSDEGPSGAPAAMLTAAFWRARFGQDPRALDASLNIDGQNYRVVGILPPGFQMPGENRVDVLTPLSLDRKFLHHGNGSAKILRGIGRLRPGVTMEAAAAELRMRLAASKSAEPSLYDEHASLRMVPLDQYVNGNSRTAGIVLLGAVASILLIMSANVASLLIARAAGREREISIRIALGATAARITRHLLLEALAIAAAGIAGGLALAAFLTGLLPRLLPVLLARGDAPVMDGRLLAAVLPVAVLCSAAFAFAPLLPLPRVRVRKALVAGELALSLVLLVGALLLLQSFARLRAIAPGFRTDGLVTMSVSLGSGNNAADFRRELRARLERIPGAIAVSFADSLPPNEFSRTSAFSRAGRPHPSAGARNDAVLIRLVDHEFFEALGIRLKRGRLFTAREVSGGAAIAVVNRALADRYFPGEDPIGKRIDGPSWKTVAGVVDDTRNDGLRNPTRPEIYLPFSERMRAQGGGVTHANGLSVLVRVSGDPAPIAQLLPRIVHGIDPSLLTSVNTMNRQWADLSAVPKSQAEVVAAFAALALVLASVGIYGVVSHLVLLRRKEMGIRLALGARPRDIAALVVGEAVSLAAAGAVTGVAGALALSRLLSGLLFEIKPQDPLTLGLAALFLLMLAAAAAAAPARRAAREDPCQTLRAE